MKTTKVPYRRTGKTKTLNAMGMRPMQARAYEARRAQHLILKAPPGAGKSRALMYIGLDKLANQGIRKVIVAVPETTIGASFRPTDLVSAGFFRNWEVERRWNLCLSGVEAETKSRKVRVFRQFLDSASEVLVCTHATLRLAFDAIVAEHGIQAFDDCLVAIDEFHHVSASEGNRLGTVIRQLLARGQAHVLAMTGSYFRGDAVPVLRPEDELLFQSVSSSYFEQLDGYEHLRSLDIVYSFYADTYVTALPDILDPGLKTIIHIPHRGSAEACDAKQVEVGAILDCLGRVLHRDPVTGFDHVETPDGRILKVADLVDDAPGREIVKAALTREIRRPDGTRDDEADRAKVDVIIALGMAKEGFDWIWNEHSICIGQRASLTEIMQILGRVTRDAPGKMRARFTNLVAEPRVGTKAITDAVNDMLKAIAGAMLMEQVMQPGFRFYRREANDAREPVSMTADGVIQVGIRGLAEPPTDRARAIIATGMDDLVAAACQRMTLATIADATTPQLVTQVVLGEVVRDAHPGLTPEEIDAIRQDLAARLAIFALARDPAPQDEAEPEDRDPQSGPRAKLPGLLRQVRKLINVVELDIDLIEGVNPFRHHFDVNSKNFDAPLLQRVRSLLVAKRTRMTEEEARTLWPRIKLFRAQVGREPDPGAADALERRLAEALAWIRARKAEKQRETAREPVEA
ncbi:DEAD/DEAH box helicase [Cereibacter sphaeroides]|uniref:DEAD/DEAH box helicase n=1 Tax=Cereibacter sphaeroides TaxID=1063 RepID=UPI001F3FA455|nr:DEAD/DEAH box helicase [Cereibacter sphaeroides]MCE6957670.1 DEAD/DEAH box helicase [Cereibacter sphaeroides]MCE6971410.1 DEAD/DEAH box helicase [Cereibacter sphaeroides]